MSTSISITFSYKSPNSNVGHFMKIEDIDSLSLQKVVEVFSGINRNLFAYETGHLHTLKQVEKRLENRFTNVSKELVSIDSVNKHTRLKRIIFTIITLGIYWLIQEKKIYSLKKAHQSLKHEFVTIQRNFHYQIKKLEKKEEDKKTHPLQRIVSEVKAKQLQDVTAEYNRLKENPRIASLFSIFGDCKSKKFLAFGHSIELQEALQETHYTLNHGLNYQLVCLNMVASILTQKFSNIQAKDQCILRHESVFYKFDKKGHSVETYKKQLETRTRTDADYSDSLISCDIDLHNMQGYESAFSFYMVAQNIALSGNPNLAKKCLMEILKDFFPLEHQQTIIHSIYKEVYQLCQSQEFRTSGLGLYSICVPKERFDKVAYIAAPFGYPYFMKYTKDQLDDIQRGKPYTKISANPQVRVLAQMLDASEGDFIVCHSANEDIEHALFEKIDTIIEKHFCNLT